MLLHAPNTTQIGPECRASALAGMAVALAAAIAIIIPRPLVSPMPDRGLRWRAPPIALPLVGLERRAVSRDVLRKQGCAGRPRSLVAHPAALLTRVPGDHADHGGTIVGVGPGPSPLLRPPTRRSIRVRRGRAVVPRRCGTARRPHKPCLACHPSGRSRCGWLGGAAATSAAVCVAASTHGLGGR